MTFALHPSIDADALHRRFAATGHVQIAPFLAAPGAAALRDQLAGREDWRLVLNAGARVYEIDRAGRAAMSDEQRNHLERLVAQAAISGFQYRYETIRVPDEAPARTASATLLDRFATFLSEGPARELMRAITGAADILFADAQATCYGPGHFLTVHDDDIEGKQRRAAYVFGLTPEWRAEWGGLLMFHDAQGDIARALLPRMNALNLFAVPQPHSVSLVTPFAGAQRVSVTGWLRAAR